MSLTLSLLNGGPNFLVTCPGLRREVTPGDLVAVCRRILEAQRHTPPLTEVVEVRRFDPKGRPAKLVAPPDLDLAALGLDGIIEPRRP